VRRLKRALEQRITRRPLLDAQSRPLRILKVVLSAPAAPLEKAWIAYRRADGATPISLRCAKSRWMSNPNWPIAY
jgi:hypothetical protein